MSAEQRKPRGAASAVVVDMHARELRLNDFKSAYARAFTECLEAEDRVLESLQDMRALERALMLKVDATSQDLLANSRSLTQQHEGVRADIARASQTLTAAANVIQRMRSSLLGPEGVLAQTHAALLGVVDAKGNLVKSGTVHQVHAALVTGKGSVTNRMSAQLDTMAAALDTSLNGEDGSAARFELRIKKATGQASTALTKMAAALDQARAVQSNWVLLAAAAAGVLAVGMLAGAVLTRMLMH